MRVFKPDLNDPLVVEMMATIELTYSKLVIDAVNGTEEMHIHQFSKRMSRQVRDRLLAITGFMYGMIEMQLQSEGEHDCDRDTLSEIFKTLYAKYTVELPESEDPTGTGQPSRN